MASVLLTALRAGLRKGELIALKWCDIQFGEHPDDRNRYILVQRNYAQGRFTRPKSKKSRAVLICPGSCARSCLGCEMSACSPRC